MNFDSKMDFTQKMLTSYLIKLKTNHFITAVRELDGDISSKLDYFMESLNIVFGFERQKVDRLIRRIVSIFCFRQEDEFQIGEFVFLFKRCF